jgi:hypothetical protein
MAINNQMNQFEMSALKASIARGTNPFTIPVIVDPDETATLIPGDFVKISTESSKVITVLKCAATDPAIGVILASPKKQSFVAEDAVEIGLFSTILWLEASGAVTAGDDLEYVVSGAKVKTNAGVNPICAVALTGASSGALIIAQIKTSITFSPTIVGGTVNNTPIGAGTPNTGKFTTLQSTGAATLASASVTAGLVAKVIGSGAAVALTPGATPAIDATLGKIFTVTPGEAEAITVSGGVVGQEIILKVLTSGATSYNLTFGTGFGANAGALATGVTTAKVFVVRFVHDGTSFVEVGRTAAM